MADLNSTCVGKKCSSCGKLQPLGHFGVCSAYKDGRRGQCNACRSQLQAKYRKLNPRRGPAKRMDALSIRRHKLKSRYGLTPQDFDALLLAQGGKCAICETDKPGGRWHRFHVDHCHETGNVRGLLCHECNVTLGKLGDSLNAVMRYAEYLSKSNRHWPDMP